MKKKTPHKKGKEEIENFALREIKSFLKGYFRYILNCRFI